MKVPYKERIAFLKYQSASICFEMVHDVSSFLLRTRMHRREKIHDPLLVAMHVLYARPFKQRKPLRLEESIVPKKYQVIHAKLLTLRDKMHAHTDLDGPEVVDGVLMNDLTGYTKSGWTTFGIGIFNPSPQMHKAILLLTEHLQKTAHAAADEIWRRYMRSEKVPDGVAVLNLDHEDGRFLKPHPVAEHTELEAFYVDVREYLGKD